MMTIETKHCRNCGRTFTECTAADVACPFDKQALFRGAFPVDVRVIVGRHLDDKPARVVSVDVPRKRARVEWLNQSGAPTQEWRKVANLLYNLAD
jgi:hypothetical protein